MDTSGLSEAKQNARTLWGEVGDYGSIVEKIAVAGRTAVAAGSIGSGDKVLDVACGTGNATIPAAQAGANVTGLDLSPALLDQGRAAAEQAGVEIEWVEGDAEQLPFEDGSFDVVLSVFGCMFAPDHRAAAEEIARVMKPGGRMAVCSWTPEGATGRFFVLVSSHMPPPPDGFQPPVLWGEEAHVREIFEGTGLDLEFERAVVPFAGESVESFMAEYEDGLPPLAAAKQALSAEGKWDALRSDLLDLYADLNESGDDSVRYDAEFLVAKGTKPA
jgi:ubiquinone/menaquinone biosynthesis C-methylase UbiE